MSFVPQPAPFNIGDQIRHKRTGEIHVVRSLRPPHKPGVDWKVGIGADHGELFAGMFEPMVSRADWTGKMSPADWLKRYAGKSKDTKKIMLATRLVSAGLGD